jgi:ABC-2 type transport system ATP-binding protein
MVRGGRLIAVERISELLGKARRTIAVELAGPGGTEALEAVPGVEDLERSGNRLTFGFAGDLDRVVKALAAGHVVDLEVTHPSLEEVFLTYYRDGA